MNLSTGEMALIFAGCVLTIGVIVVLWQVAVCLRSEDHQR